MNDPSISSVLQQIIDRTKDTSDIMLILCGSSMSFMERQVLGAESPLYGRRTAQIKVMPMDVYGARDVLGAVAESLSLSQPLDPAFVVEAYGICGGIPLYLEQFNPALSLERNLAERVFAQDAFLFGEPAAFLMQEVRRPESYNAIIEAIAQGRNQAKEIAEVSGVDRNSITPYLKRLEELQVIKREKPVPNSYGARAQYRMSDQLFAFWYAITARYQSAINAGFGEWVAQAILEQELPTYLGHVFEDVCQQWVIRQMALRRIKALPMAFGRWWGTNPLDHKPTDIDVTVTTHEGLLVLGECKWRNDPMDVRVLRTLEARAAMFSHEKKLLLGFSKTGFTEGAQAYAKDRPLMRLVTLRDMFEIY